MSRKPYVPPIPGPGWFFTRPRYIRYLARELSCLFILAYSLLMVLGFKRLSEGPSAWENFLELLQHPASILFHAVALVFTTYHSVTWFNLTPKAMPVRVGGKSVPDGVISGTHYVAWALLSLIILILAGVF